MGDNEVVTLVVSKNAWEKFAKFVNTNELNVRIPCEMSPLFSELISLAARIKDHEPPPTGPGNTG